ncbi:hypothetical protein CV093_06290 [Oceanobacillus sp. 143]|uniref:Uncharacterized protein n=1 Tax=Oceanobacillus zhaokaii TaxID=2052660 RepID=A0A345PER2_9BACI|nr:hypothetical protein [Oceanobacillus zhaokaii]AXI08492.1 hypothetical protein CUC15_05970 [Oceanobacillus zhaokaii]QGS68336.1 hypothetical protein CV093_06290 [Oceanobacillus sp. 143]
MKNLPRSQALIIINEILEEDVTDKFNEQAENAGEHGDPSFVVTNSRGESVEVFVDWNKEEDILSYSINEEFKSE